ncbi:MAG: TRAP transporter large permease [Microvirga sp.]
MAALVLFGSFFLLIALRVPVAFALGLACLPVLLFEERLSPMVLFNETFKSYNSFILLAVPFFLLTAHLMNIGGITDRLVRLSRAMVGNWPGALAQINVLLSVFFAGISGSSTADVAVLARTVAPEMSREGYDKAFTAALIASASTIANLIPPSIMAIVYGATGNVSIGGLFLGGVVPGLLVGFGLMIFSHFFGPSGVRRKRATFGQFAEAAKLSALPLMIPFIIMGGILSGFFTPTEAGLVAVAYIVFILIPLVNRGHIKNLPRDFANAGLLYSIPMAAVAAASAFGWMLAYLRGPDVVAAWIEGFAGHNGLIIMFLLVVLFVIVGDFMDAVPAIIIFMPIITALTALGEINPVHMGVVIVVTLAFGLITPPYGLSLLMASKFTGVGFMAAVMRSLPLYLVFFATIAFCIFFPEVVLWLPKKLLPESVGCFKSPTGAGYICPQF